MPYEQSLTEATQALRLAWQQINDDMRDYPTPISGCDAQYNHMVAQRSAISNALAALNELPFVATPRIQSPGTWAESR